MVDPNAVLLTLDFIYTREERAEAKSLVTRHTLRRGSKSLTWLVFLLIAGGLVLAAWQRYHQMTLGERKFFLPFFIVVWIIVFAVIRKRDKDPSQSRRMEFFYSGIRVATGGADVRIPWSSFSKTIESEKLILLKSASLFYSIPRRVLPSAEWASWINSMVAASSYSPAIASRPADPRAPATDELTITIEYRHRFRDVLNYMLASWAMRAILLAWIGIQVGVFISITIARDSTAVVPTWKMLLFFCMPQCIVGSAFFLFVFTARSWLRQRRALMIISLSESQIFIRTNLHDAVFPWTHFANYKETRRSFLIWGGLAKCRLLLPKSTFASPDEVDACGDLLAQKLAYSIWFWGF